MSRGPRVSVIIPCFNLGRYLDEAVDSVLAQAMDDLEILIVDDGSTEPATVALLDGYERPKTTVFRTANRGLAAARNLLIERAAGDYLCALDADDRLDPAYLEKACAVLDHDPDVAFVSSWLRAFGAEDWQWRQERCDLPALLAEDTVMTAALVRREAVVAVGGYDESMPHPGDEDWDLWIRLVRAGYRGTIIPEVLFEYRRRAGSMSTECVEGKTHLELVRYLVDKHEDAYQEHVTDVLLWKEREIARLLRANDRVERRLGSFLEPVLDLRRDELGRLRSRLETARGGTLLQADSSATDDRRGEIEAVLAASHAEYPRATAELAALRRSWSWRLTAPLRALATLLGYAGRRQG